MSTLTFKCKITPLVAYNTAGIFLKPPSTLLKIKHWKVMGVICRFRIVVFNTTFQQHLRYIVAVSVIGGENRRKTAICRKSLTNQITYCCIKYIPPWAVFELITLEVICTYCTGNCKSNYHMITITTGLRHLQTTTTIVLLLC